MLFWAWLQRLVTMVRRNSGDQSIVSSAIEWCWKNFDADIISLSLGGESDPNATRDGPTTNAVRLAIAMEFMSSLQL